MLHQTAEFVAVLTSGLFAAAAVYVSLVEHPARMECGVEIATPEFPPSYHRGTIMQVTLAAACLLCSSAAWLAGATIACRAATSSPKSFVVPTTILRCLRLPSGPGSRHLNSQTSGPPCRSVRIMLPFCMVFLSVFPMRQLRSRIRRYNSGTDCR